MRRRKTSLPRVSILCYNRRDLERFALAVEALSARTLDLERICTDLAAEVDRLKAAPGRKRRQAAADPTADYSQSEQA